MILFCASRPCLRYRAYQGHGPRVQTKAVVAAKLDEQQDEPCVGLYRSLD